MKVRRKPSETVAFVIDSSMDADAIEAEPKPSFQFDVDAGTLRLYVAKHDEWALITYGDAIVRELDGSGWYPCERSVFEATYERITDDWITPDPRGGPGVTVRFQ